MVIITAGIARKPGMSREDLLNTNTEHRGRGHQGGGTQSPNAILINVANPLDAMCYVA